MKSIRHILTAFCALSLHFSSLAVPGDLDLTFGTVGKVTTDFGGNDSGGRLAIQSDGRIVVAGYSGLVRYNAAGILDTSFNGTGKVDTGLYSGLAIQSDGKIVVAASQLYGIGNYFGVVGRFNADGSLDTTFGTVVDEVTDLRSGYQEVGWSNQSIVSGIAIQSGGKIVVAGSSYGSFALARLNGDGSHDTPFGSPTTPIVNGGRCSEMVIQSDGKIVLVGTTGANPEQDFVVVRYHSNGSLDASFNGTGIVITDLFNSDDKAYSMALQDDGKIVVVGQANFDGAMVRYNPNGTLDPSFNGNGKITTGISAGVIGVWGNSVVLDSNRKIIIAGYAYHATEGGGFDTDFGLARYHQDGSLDATLGTAGRVTTDFAGSHDYGQSMALQNDGKIVVAGLAANGNYDIGLVRYVGGAPSPLEAWKLAQLGSYQVPDLGDTDFDGLVHLAEYALNLSPTAPSLPPPAGRHLYAEGERLRMFFTRDPARYDVTLEVQSADSPAGPWTTVAASTLGGVTTGPGYVGGDDATPGLKTVEVRDTVNISPATASRYLRVKVTH